MLFGFLDLAVDTRPTLFILRVLSAKLATLWPLNSPRHPRPIPPLIFPLPSRAPVLVCSHPRQQNLVKINPLIHRLHSIRQLLQLPRVIFQHAVERRCGCRQLVCMRYSCACMINGGIVPAGRPSAVGSEQRAVADGGTWRTLLGLERTYQLRAWVAGGDQR